MKILHNPRCTKSRETLTLIRGAGVEPDVVEYLKDPPTVAELKVLVRQLGMAPEELVRKGESVYKERYAGRRLTEDAWLAALAAHPVLLERPIVIEGDRAVLGRPPENVHTLLMRKKR